MFAKKLSDVLVVGAGMAGLMAARALVRRDLAVTVVEREAVPGGRMITRALGAGQADEGAQYFTARTPEFQQFLSEWRDDGFVFEWTRVWNNASLMGTSARDTLPRYAVRGGMSALIQHLAHGLDVHEGVTIASLERTENGWLAVDTSGSRYQTLAVLLTPPVPESLALLRQTDSGLDTQARAQLEAIEYERCLTGVFRVEGGRGLAAPGAIQRPEANIRWIADNQRKGISPHAIVLTVQAGPLYSRQLWDVPDQQVLSALRVDLLPFLPDEARIVQAQLRRWLYAHPVRFFPGRCLLTEGPAPLALAGDAFQETGVEGAALSGLAAAQALADRVAARV